MKNPLVSGNEAKDIDDAVGRVLAEFKGYEPPLDLHRVIDHLKLDLEYYSTKNLTGFREMVHKLKVGTKQIVQRPMLLVDAIRSLELRALYLPDAKKILVDRDLHRLQYRWAEGHEIGHSIIWWHKDFLMGDSDQELSPACHAIIEAEANYACGRMIFFQNRFVEDAMSLPVCWDSVMTLYRRYGNTLKSTFWRFIESHQGSKAIVGTITSHPHLAAQDFDPTNPCKYTIQSPVFRDTFSGTTELDLFAVLQGYCPKWKKQGPLGSGEVALPDSNGDLHAFVFESFQTKYDVFSIGRQVSKKTSRTVSLRA